MTAPNQCRGRQPCEVGEQVAVYPTSRAFLQIAQEYLERDEVVNNLVLGISLRAAETGAEVEPPFFVTVGERSPGVESAGFALAGVMTPPRKLVLCAGTGSAAARQGALGALVRHLIAAGTAVPGILAPEPLAGGFARAWSQAANRVIGDGMHLRLYQLSRVVLPEGVPGRLRPARPDEIDQLAAWAAAFARDVGESPPGDGDDDEARAEVEEKLGRQDIHLWEVGGRPVSMAARTRATRNTVAVSLVYTPPELRRRGYASACVAGLSQELLDSGFDFCSLFADRDSVAPNRIYQSIGYEPVGDFDEYGFAGT